MSFVDELKAAELHWHFEQAREALNAELYLPAVLSYLAAIENSIRSTLHQLDEDGYPANDDLGATLSNRLLRDAHAAGMPIEALALGEEEILAGITTNKPNVGIVAVRHDLLHGNVLPYVDRVIGFFTPECLRDLAIELDRIATKWAQQLGCFRRKALKYL